MDDPTIPTGDKIDRREAERREMASKALHEAVLKFNALNASKEPNDYSVWAREWMRARAALASALADLGGLQ